jgi:hypothetical protein
MLKRDGKAWTQFTRPGDRVIVGSCERDKKPSFQTMHEISGLAEKLLASQKGLRSFLNDNRSPKADIHERKYKYKNRVNAPNLSMCTFPKLVYLL